MGLCEHYNDGQQQRSDLLKDQSSGLPITLDASLQWQRRPDVHSILDVSATGEQSIAVHCDRVVNMALMPLVSGADQEGS